MIIDLHGFIREERFYWNELEGFLQKMESDALLRMDLAEARRFNYLYQRASSGLARLAHFSAERETHRYLQSLVARAYCEIHETRQRPHRLAPLSWMFGTLPRAFRAHIAAFWLALAVMSAGLLFGGMSLALDPGAKQVLMPFEHLKGSPSERVAREERAEEDRLKGIKSRGAAMYMTHNTKVSILTMVLGASWGIGTVIMLFYNGIILGAVCMDYMLAGEGTFLISWLLPHGSVEIPAIIFAGQAGLVLGGAIIGKGNSQTMRERMRAISADLVTLIGGVALLLVWAGIIEAFISQYHEPVLSYSFKTGLGSIQLVLLILFLAFAGRGKGREGA